MQACLSAEFHLMQDQCISQGSLKNRAYRMNVCMCVFIIYNILYKHIVYICVFSILYILINLIYNIIYIAYYNMYMSCIWDLLEGLTSCSPASPPVAVYQQKV